MQGGKENFAVAGKRLRVAMHRAAITSVSAVAPGVLLCADGQVLAYAFIARRT